ncbi:MAG: dTDP-4-dehydrorhamnose reductase [Hyphomonadaceae bacterium]
MIPLRIACIGKHGQTAQALSAVAAGYPTIELHQAGRDTADLTKPETLEAFVHQTQAHVVINAGAYNLVDRAENEKDIAMAVNAVGPHDLALICKRLGVHFIHMSTDCVFDGSKTTPYVEDDVQMPASAYGISKSAGEIAVKTMYPEAVTTRVCWVFSEFAESFVSKVIGWARTQSRLRIVSDQVGPPTYAPDIATALLRIARLKADGARDLSGYLHLAAPGAMSRAEMARAILAASKRQGGPFAEIDAVTTAEFNAPAKRPLNARLSGVKATERLGLSWTPWEEALDRSVRGVLARKEGTT